jgi:hypothetical protein
LCGGSVEDILQLLIHLAHPIGVGYEERIQKRGHSSHVLTGLGEGGEQPLRTFNHRGLSSLKHQFVLVQVG